MLTLSFDCTLSIQIYLHERTSMQGKYYKIISFASFCRRSTSQNNLITLCHFLQNRWVTFLSKRPESTDMRSATLPQLTFSLAKSTRTLFHQPILLTSLPSWERNTLSLISLPRLTFLWWTTMGTVVRMSSCQIIPITLDAKFSMLSTLGSLLLWVFFLLWAMIK